MAECPSCGRTACGCGCGYGYDCCCRLSVGCCYSGKRKRDSDEIIFESDSNNGYDVEENNYSLDQLQKDYDDLATSKKFNDLHDQLFEQMKQKYPERVKVDPLPLVWSPSFSEMLTRGQLRDLIDAYENHVEDLMATVPCCEDDYPAYYEVENHMKYFSTSGDFQRIAYYYTGGNEYSQSMFDEFIQQLTDYIWENLRKVHSTYPYGKINVSLTDIFKRTFLITVGGDCSWD